MSKQTIWNYLKTHTDLPDVSIAGIMGNMEAESNCEACRVQGDFTADRRVSKEYAANVNAGRLPNWYSDAKGWGLCQWTYYSRKQNLKSACDSYGLGIENESAQLAFMLSEMQNEYVMMWHQLLVAQDIRTAAQLVCHNYERPAVENVAERADYGQTIYNQFHGKDITPEPEPEPSPSPAPVDDDRTAKIISLLEQIIALLKE